MRDPAEILEDILNEHRTTNVLLRAASRTQLDDLLKEVSADKIDLAIIRTLVDHRKPSPTLMKAVTEQANVTRRAVQIHVAQLMDKGVIQRLGSGNRIDYRLTPIFSSSQLSRFKRSVPENGTSREALHEEQTLE